jgi:hypothetical protein
MIQLCKKCLMLEGLLFLMFGVLFLLRDLNVWDYWNIQWWSIAFLMLGLTILLSNTCPKCKELN